MGLEFVAYDKTETFRRQFAASDSSADLLWNDTSLATFALDDDHAAVPALTAPGARCRVMLDGGSLFRGRVARSPGTGPTGQITFAVESDMRKFKDWFGWPKPSASITAQDVEYDVHTGTSEDVFVAAVSANVARLGVPWTVTASAGRGSSARAELRFHTLAEKLFPLISADRLGVVLTYGAGRAVAVSLRTPKTIAGVLNADTGVLDAYSYERWAPSATRVIGGGREEGVDREFILDIDSDREDDWGDVIEIFKDLRNTEVGADLSIETGAALAETGPGVSMSMDLTETKRFGFRTHYELGDVLPFDIAGQQGSEVITRVTIADTVSNGVTITPHIGDTNVDPLARLGARVAELRGRLRDLGRR